MNMQHGHEHAVWTWICSMDMDMQHDMNMQHGHEHAVLTRICSMAMDKQHRHGHAAVINMGLQHDQGHAAWFICAPWVATSAKGTSVQLFQSPVGRPPVSYTPPQVAPWLLPRQGHLACPQGGHRAASFLQTSTGGAPNATAVESVLSAHGAALGAFLLSWIFSEGDPTSTAAGDDTTAF
jgi:hypothetical protein